MERIQFFGPQTIHHRRYFKSEAGSFPDHVLTKCGIALYTRIQLHPLEQQSNVIKSVSVFLSNAGNVVHLLTIARVRPENYKYASIT